MHLCVLPKDESQGTANKTTTTDEQVASLC